MHRPALDPATAAIRLAVRPVAESRAGRPLIVAVSGGADSLALLAATVFEANKTGSPVTAVIVDHGLQAGSDATANTAAETARSLGASALVVPVTVAESGEGLEAAAREARYAALRAKAAELDAPVLLGHTLDDQAETVLLGLARGSGSGSLQGMLPERVDPDDTVWLRPLLGVRRSQTRESCAAQGISVWDDPHNSDARFTRVRVRESVLPVLETELGPGIAEALARTAEQLQEDNAAFDEMIADTIEDIVEHAEAGISMSASALEANPPALRNRIIRLVAQSEFGVSLSRSQTLEIARLATDWHGQGPIDVSGCSVTRTAGQIVFTAG